MAKSPPSKEYLTALAERLKRKYGARNLLLLEVDDFIRLRKKVVIPDEYAQLGKIAEYQSHAVGDLHRRATDLVAATMPVPHVPPMNPDSKDSQENADLREDWLLGVYEDVMLPIWDKSVESLMRGLTVYQVDLRLHRWGDIRRREGESADAWNSRVGEHRRKQRPFAARHVSPETYFPIRVENGVPMEVMEITKREAIGLGRQYGLAPDRDNKPVRIDDVGDVNLSGTWPDSWDFIEYWDEDFAVYMVGDRIVQTVEHHYGRTPYFQAYLNESSSEKPEDAVTPISFYLMAEAQKLSELITVRMNHAYLTGFPYRQHVATNYEAIAEGGTPPTSTIGLGGEFIEPPGWEFKYVVPPPVGQDLQVMQQFFTNNVDRLSLAPVLSGMSPSGISNAATLTMIAAAKALFEPGIKNLLRAWDDMGGFIQWLVEKKIKRPVPIYYQGKGKWLELDKKHIDGYYRVRHTLEPMVPGERYQKMLAWADAQARGGVDMNFWREEGLGIHKPLEMERKVRQEQLRNMPQYANTLMAEFLKAIAWGAQMAAGENAPPVAQPPVGPGGVGATVVPGVQQGLGAGLGPTGGNPMMTRPEGIASQPEGGMP